MTVSNPQAPVAVPPAQSRALRESWKVSPSGVWLVAQLELRQRVRSTKWKWALGTVAALIGGMTFLIWAAMRSFGVTGGDQESGAGDVIFGLVVFFVLFLGLVVSPTLSATSINGDVRDGTLAPLQATGLSAADIVLGKLLASWAASLAFVAVALPFMIFTYFDGQLPALAMVTITVVLAVELLVVCALGLGWSALTARPPASAVLTYTTVAVLAAVLPIVFGLLSVVSTSEMKVTERFDNYYDKSAAPVGAVDDGSGNFIVCEEQTSIQTVSRTDRLWWLLAVNPYVIVADSAPSPHGDATTGGNEGILGGLKHAVRSARLGPDTVHDYCSHSTLTSEEVARQNDLNALPALWPWGLLAQGLLALGAVALAVRRVSVPYGKLPTGSRVA